MNRKIVSIVLASTAAACILAGIRHMNSPFGRRSRTADSKNILKAVAEIEHRTFSSSGIYTLNPEIFRSNFDAQDRPLIIRFLPDCNLHSNFTALNIGPADPDLENRATEFLEIRFKDQCSNPKAGFVAFAFQKLDELDVWSVDEKGSLKWLQPGVSD